MAESPQLKLRVVSDDEFIAALEAELQSDEASSASTPKPVTDPSNLGFDLRDVSEIVGMVPSMVTLARLLAGALRRHRPRRIYIESPLGRLLFEPTADMSDAELRAKLQQLTAAI